MRKPRRIRAITPAEITAAVKAFQAAGIEVGQVHIEAATGAITITAKSEPASNENEADAWLKRNAG